MSTGSHRICEICGVRERHINRPLKFSRFPIDPARCKQWVQVVGKEDLIHLPIRKINALKCVCSDHFKENDFKRKSNRLKKKAIPSLNLSAPPLLDDQLTDFPPHSKNDIQQTTEDIPLQQIPVKTDLPGTSSVDCYADTESRNTLLKLSALTSSKESGDGDSSTDDDTMHDENNRKCLKCGASGSNDSKVVLYRFPRPGVGNIKRCELWAKYCFPDKDWSSPAFQQKLNSQHKMLCNKHFKWTAFIDIENKKLHRHATPEDVEVADDVKVNLSVKSASSEQDTPHMVGIEDSTVNVVQETPNAGQDDACESPCHSAEVDETPEKGTTNLRVVTCDQCHQVVEGYRWVCVSCSGLVLCGSCVSHGVHPTCYVLRVPPLRPQWEVQAVLRAVRQALAMSAFADRLAEPLCDYEISQDLSNEIKVESEDDPHPEFDGSELNSVQDEEEPIEAVMADSLSDAGPDPLSSPAPTQKTLSLLGVKRKASFEHQSFDNMTETCDMNSETESHTDVISLEGTDADRDHVMKSADDDSDATESQAGSSKVDTNTNITGKLSRHLQDPQSLEFADKLAEPSTSRLYVNVKRARLSDIKYSIPTNAKLITPSNVGVSGDKLRSVQPKMKYKTPTDVKIRLLTRLGALSSNKDLGSCDKQTFRKPIILCKNRLLQGNVASPKSPTPKPAPGLVTNVSIKPGFITNVSTKSVLLTNVSKKPGLVPNVSTKSVLVTNLSTKPGLVTNLSTKPGLVTDVSTKPGLATNVSTKSVLVTNLSTKPGLVTNVSTKPRIVTNVSTMPGLATNVTLSEETSVPITEIHQGSISNVLKKTFSEIPR